MNKPALIEKLNRAIALELCAVIQYNQYSNVLMGADRRTWRDLFKDMSDGGLKDAREFGFHVVALGGTPTIEHAPVKQADNIQDMLNNALELAKQMGATRTEEKNALTADLANMERDREAIEAHLADVKSDR